MEQQGLPGFFHVVARYGYNERVVQDAGFVQVGPVCHLTRCTLLWLQAPSAPNAPQVWRQQQSDAPAANGVLPACSCMQPVVDKTDVGTALQRAGAAEGGHGAHLPLAAAHHGRVRGPEGAH